MKNSFPLALYYIETGRYDKVYHLKKRAYVTCISTGLESMPALHTSIRVVSSTDCSLSAMVSRASSSSQTLAKLRLKGTFAAFVKDLSSILTCSPDGPMDESFSWSLCFCSFSVAGL